MTMMVIWWMRPSEAIQAGCASPPLAVISETGADMSRLPTVGHCASWLGLCPGTKITADRMMSGKTKRVANRAAQALRSAAAALRSSKSALGAYFGRMSARMDKPKPVAAAAHELARLIYTMLTQGQECADQAQDHLKDRYRQRVSRQLTPSAPTKWACNSSPSNEPPEFTITNQSLGWCFLRELTTCFACHTWKWRNIADGSG